MFLMLLVGALIGVLNGLATTLLRVPSFIVTLGMMLALTGLVRYLTGGAATGNPVDSFREIGRGGFTGVPVLEIIPYPVLILTVLAIAAVWLMRRPFGRGLISVGDNPDAARLSGTSRVVAQDPGLRAVVAGRHCRRDHPRRVRRRTPLGGPRLRVHRDHRRRPGRRGPRRRPRLGALGGGRRVRAGALVHPADLLGVPSTWRDTVQGAVIILAVVAGGRAWQFGRRKLSRAAALGPTTQPRPPRAPTRGE